VDAVPAVAWDHVGTGRRPGELSLVGGWPGSRPFF
jgi:hypothetical protein